MINFNQLRAFYYAAKYENYTLAAESLFITQPAVTAQIKILEDHSNLKLFKKRGRNIYLTDEGRTLYGYAKKVFDFEKQIEDAIEEMRELKRGVLRIGTTKTYARFFMPFLMTNFHEAYPMIKIYLDEGSSRDMSRSLLNFKNDIAVVAKAEDHPDIDFVPFSKEELVLIVSPGHRLASKKLIDFEEISQEPVIMKENGSGTRKIVNELFIRNNTIPNVLMETSNSEFIKQLVQRGEGISFLVKQSVASELKEKKLTEIHIKGQKIFLDVSIAYLKNQNHSPPARAFLDILEKLASRDKPSGEIGELMSKILARRKR